jgi:sporadic carbohydrate cluster protein (TIGR04323 family)
MGERVPQHIQNIVIRDYCNHHQLHFLLSVSEYAIEDSHLILYQALDELSRGDGVIAYSLFQLPEGYKDRRALYQQFVRQGNCLHCAVEGINAGSMVDFERIEVLWRIRLTLPHCIETISNIN